MFDFALWKNFPNKKCRKRMMRNTIKKLQKLLNYTDVNEHRKKSLFYLTIPELKLELERVSYLVKLEKFAHDIGQELLFFPNKFCNYQTQYVPVSIVYDNDYISNTSEIIDSRTDYAGNTWYVANSSNSSTS